MTTLDKSKPYGEVFGCPGVAFEQGGRHYSADGALVGGMPCLTTDEFTAMSRDGMLAYLQKNQVLVAADASDDELRAECREVFV